MLEPVSLHEPDSARPPRWSDGTSLDVDDLMDELRARAGAARRSHEQLEALLDAVTAVSADLELSEVLGRIVRSACALVNAKYGALGVLGPDGEHLMEFITHGVTSEEREAIGEPPRGHGILGLLIRDPRHQRLADLSAHPDSFGFPPNHPPMRSFLGTPIRIRDEVYGNLYLAERQGEEEFSEADEAMLVALAAAAGVAIDNARLFERAQRQTELAQMISELTQSLLESEAEDSALAPMAERLCGLTGAAVCFVVLRDEQGSSSVRATGHGDGVAAGAAEPHGRRPDLQAAHWAQVLEVGQELLLLPSSTGGTTAEVLSDLASAGGLPEPGPLAVVPISAGAGDLGHLLMMWESGSGDVASMSGLSAFSQQAGLGLIAARAQHDKAMVAMLEDRNRIARDMHDHVIQRLFATGLSLQAAERLAVHPVVRTRISEAVDSLDVAIKVIRSTIFELHTMATAGTAAQLLEELVRSFSPSLGYEATLEVDVDLAGLDDALLADLTAVVREGLSNVARHAHSSAAQVLVRRDAARLVVVVADNGRGLDAGGRRSGLANLQQRAAARSGTFEVELGDPSGTRLTWTVPCRDLRPWLP
jgi:signal transduction histidine kinase